MLVAFVDNVGRADAELLQAFIKVKGMTREYEALGWRYLTEQAGMRGSSYTTVRTINLPHPDGRGETWLAVVPEDGIWRLFPVFSELGGFDSYRLERGRSYETRLKVRAKEWGFTISIDKEGILSCTEPEEL